MGANITNIKDHQVVLTYPWNGFPSTGLPFEVTGRSVHLLFMREGFVWTPWAPITFGVFRMDPDPANPLNPDWSTKRPVEVPIDECQPWKGTQPLEVTIEPGTSIDTLWAIDEITFPNCAPFYTVHRVPETPGDSPVAVLALMENLRTKGV